jgi:hypothetical protein
MTAFSGSNPPEIEVDEISETRSVKDWRARLFITSWATAVLVATGGWFWFVIRIGWVSISWLFE